MKRLLMVFLIVSDLLLANTTYKPDKSIKDITINSVGSDTLAGLMTFWAEDFKKYYPSSKFQIQAAGSSTGPVALIEGSTDLAPMSREMKGSEIKSFQEKFGYPPTKIAVAIDAIGVFVNKQNPTDSLSVEQLDGIFSANQSCGGVPYIKWSELDPALNLSKDTITAYGRNSVSGTYSFFKDTALCGGDFKKNVNEQPGSSSVIQSVARSDGAIGYTSVGYVSPDVKLLSISSSDTDGAISPTKEHISKGIYPLSRSLYIYINKIPTKPVSKKVMEFLKFALSAQGQAIVAKDGFVPLNDKLIKENLAKLK